MAKSKQNWVRGFPHRNVNAMKAYAEINKIVKSKDGRVLPEDVISAAKPVRSTLHPLFEWDDTKAAAEHRKTQARLVLRSFTVIRSEAPKYPSRSLEVVRESVTGKDGETRVRNVYRTMEEIMADPDKRDELLTMALRELVSVQRKFRQLQELAIVFREIDTVLVSHPIK